MTIKEIAKKHGVPVSSIEAELKKGMAVEREHMDSEAHRRQYALDHLEEIPDYYTRLEAMEKEAAKEEKKGSEGLDEKEAGKAFEKWTSLGEKWENKPVSPSDESKEHYPTVCLKIAKGDKKFSIGEDIEVGFKACITSIRKSEDGVRVEMELKEAKFD